MIMRKIMDVVSHLNVAEYESPTLRPRCRGAASYKKKKAEYESVREEITVLHYRCQLLSFRRLLILISETKTKMEVENYLPSRGRY